MFMVDTGVRVSGVAGLSVRDIDLEAGRCRVRRLMPLASASRSITIPAGCHCVLGAEASAVSGVVAPYSVGELLHPREVGDAVGLSERCFTENPDEVR